RLARGYAGRRVVGAGHAPTPVGGARGQTRRPRYDPSGAGWGQCVETSDRGYYGTQLLEWISGHWETGFWIRLSLSNNRASFVARSRILTPRSSPAETGWWRPCLIAP